MVQVAMTPGQLRDIALACSNADMQLSRIEDEVNGKVQRLLGQWSGKSADQFRAQWSKALTRMGECRDEIKKLRKLLEKAADDMKATDDRGAGRTAL